MNELCEGSIKGDSTLIQLPEDLLDFPKVRVVPVDEATFYIISSE